MTAARIAARIVGVLVSPVTDAVGGAAWLTGEVGWVVTRIAVLLGLVALAGWLFG